MSKVRGIENLDTDLIVKKRAKADVSDDSSEGTGEDDRLQKMAQAMKTVIEVSIIKAQSSVVNAHSI